MGLKEVEQGSFLIEKFRKFDELYGIKEKLTKLRKETKKALKKWYPAELRKESKEYLQDLKIEIQPSNEILGIGQLLVTKYKKIKEKLDNFNNFNEKVLDELKKICGYVSECNCEQYPQTLMRESLEFIQNHPKSNKKPKLEDFEQGHLLLRKFTVIKKDWLYCRINPFVNNPYSTADYMNAVFKRLGFDEEINVVSNL